MSQLQQKTSFIGILWLCLLSCASAYHYLMVLPMPARSHYIVGSALAQGLAAAGHRVTLVSPFSLTKPIDNIIDVPIPSMLQSMSKNMGGLLNMSKMPILQQMSHIFGMGLHMTESLLNAPQIEQLRQSKQSYDAVICEIFLSEAIFGLAEHFKAPLIALGTFGAITWNTDLVGSPSPPSYVPHALLKFSDQMTLFQRIGNLAFLSYEYLYMHFCYLPQQQRLYKKFFPHNKQDFYDLRKNTSLVLLNQHVSLSFPRPYSPNMIEVGGMHIKRQRQQLPLDIERFMNASKDGVIYFSMGSNLKSKDLPLHKRSELLQALRSLKQRVLWKFEDTQLPDKPENIYISDWFSQDDILAHEKVVAFITHGGLLSTTESIYHGKPFVGIPMFGDQFLNMARAEQNGYGVTVNYNELTAAKLKAAIEHIVNDPKATQLVRQMSARFRDQLQTPLERAVYWVEHISRHKGARYLRSAAQDLNFIQYHNLDAILLLYGGLLFVCYCLMLLIRLIWHALQAFCLARLESAKKLKRN